VADVFISYARDDKAAARRLGKALSGAGLDVWWDADLPAHRAYSEIIEANLTQAKAVVVLWSATAAKSQWVRAEADFARNAGKLVQAQLDEALPPMPFNQIQCADLQGWRGNQRHKGWAKLRHSVEALVSGEDRPAPKVVPRLWDTIDSHRWKVAASLVLIIALIGLFLFLRQPSEHRKPVLAVLPFTSLDARDEGLVAGMWEDTRQAIGRNPQLIVLGPNTAQELAGKRSGAARKLADYLVEASIRSNGDRVRISANLVRTSDSAQIWSQSFDRRLDDLFKLQQEIAGEIEGHIRGRLAERGGMQPENIATSGEAYAIYSDARAKLRKRQMGRYPEAHKQLQRVVRMDPNFAPGWATLAVIKQFGFRSGEPAETSPEQDARRAIALAPSLAAGHAALGLTLGKGPAAEAELHRALALDPSDVEAMNWLANSLDGKSQRAEKLRLYSKIVEIEPLWWPALLNKLNLLFETGNSAAAEQELARVERLGDTKMSAFIKMEMLKRKGDLSGAVNVGLGYYRTASPDERELVASLLWPKLLQLGYFDIADRISAPPGDWVPLIRTNDPRALDMIEASMPPKAFWTYGPLPVVLAKVYLLNGQGPRMAKQYRAVALTPEQFEQIVGKDSLAEIAPSVALALRSAGDDGQARRLLALAEERAKSIESTDPDAMVTLARIYAVQGRSNDAIGLLSSAHRSGWLPPYLPIHTDLMLDPPFRELRNDPRFQALRQQILRHLAKERAELGPVTLN
jgi:TolB-like protein/Tfp pilus assembly protein PilF